MPNEVGSWSVRSVDDLARRLETMMALEPLQLDPDGRFVEDLLLDSLRLLELFMAIEDLCGVQFDDRAWDACTLRDLQSLMETRPGQGFSR